MSRTGRFQECFFSCNDKPSKHNSIFSNPCEHSHNDLAAAQECARTTSKDAVVHYTDATAKIVWRND